MHINNQYIKSGDIEPEKLFAIEDITDQVQAIGSAVEDKATGMLETISSSRCPEVGVGPHCSEPYPCPVKWCWDSLPENNIFELHRGGKKCLDLLNQGILFINEIPPEIKLLSIQRIQQNCEITRKDHIDKPAVKEFLDSLQYPLYFFNFETFNPAISLYDRTRTYQRIPFQFSLHIVEKEGAVPIHYSFLASGEGDPQPDILSEMKRTLGKKGSIVVYNQSFEKGVLVELGDAFLEYQEWLNQIRDRIVDLYVPFRNFSYYHPLQKGSFYIKSVFPALTGKNDVGLSLGHGDVTSLTFFNIVTHTLNGQKITLARKDLEVYCGLDTEATVWIIRRLDEISGDKA